MLIVLLFISVFAIYSSP